MRTIFKILLSLTAFPVQADSTPPAPQISECGWQASAQAIAEPWEDNSRTFSNGKTRLALLDTVEPAAGWAWLLILSPPYSELGDRQCRTIGINGSGFAGLQFEALRSSYDSATGLTFTLPAALYDSSTGGPIWQMLSVTLNQSSGAIGATLSP